MSEDKCPKCNSEKLKFGSMEQTGMGNLYYPVECEDCGFIGKQWYDVVFSGYTDENGEDVVITTSGIKKIVLKSKDDVALLDATLKETFGE